jgi:P-type Ca2+ transporter type 2C
MSAPARGLSTEEAARRLAESGANELARGKVTSAWSVLGAQFEGAMIWLLAAAGALSAVLGQMADAAAIGAIVALNAIVGFLQEYRAEKAVLALRALGAPRARVRRDDRPMVVPATDVVAGDVLLLEGGDVVAADARLVEAHALRTVESALTGESVPVEKDAKPCAADAPFAERHDHVFLGTAVAAGRGVAIVTATGMATEMGRIAGLLSAPRETRTPLQRQLEGLGRTLLVLCLGVVGLVFVLGLVRGATWQDLLLTSVALAVAAIPEGLPAVVTIALALGVQRMAARHALVRRLAAVETLGCTTVICTDKTGTLTTGRMEVRDVWARDRHAVLHAAAACNDAELDAAGGPGVGDPTEVALLKAAARAGIHRADIERENPRRTETPFDAERKRMSVRRADGILYVKGAPEVVMPLCSSGTDGALAAGAEMAGRALRVLAVAVGRGEEEQDLRLLGLAGLADPPRPESMESVARARRAGVRTVMITGDHPATARAIAEELGISGADHAWGSVHARATADDKIGIVRALKRAGEVVAMTGDGVNDAPALREAHIGIAMGRGGSEVTREAADVVLTDDNYATIVAAVEEGRGIYDNIRKTLVFLLTGSASELWLMLGASAAGLPLPLLPFHLLWINLVTDGLPAAALVMDPPDPDVLRRPPRRASEPMLGGREWRRILAVGLVEGLVVLGVFAAAAAAGDVSRARTLAFSTLVFCELFRAFAARSPHRIYWQVGVSSNLVLAGVVGFSALIQVALPTVPFLRSVFHVQELSAMQTIACVGLGLIPVSLIELAKLVRAIVVRRRPVRAVVDDGLAGGAK